MSYTYNANENPFGSTNSLDQNPFDDPNPPAATRQDSDARLEQIRQREAELERREQELNQRAEQIKHHGKNNWPFFFPLIYHDISVELPDQWKPLITRLYQLWMVLGVTLIINFIACIFILVSGSRDGGRDVGASIGYLIIMPPLSFLLWYRPIYNGYMKEQALYYYLFFFFCGWHILFSVYMIIGVLSTGSAGLVQMVQMFVGHHWAAAVLGLVSTIGWVVQGVGIAWYYRMIYNHHNQAGHTVEKAKQELASQGAKAYFTRG
ncbi:scamp-domain-containing protein [Cylindrobasidium torrendii FP15055 ss-10]|uniref:Scamp-domain-containing protein n=1 Tax=Cylindrobasidium torrendii FP15055 ss-10 TaxID=1314674 RepID=A0A0D7BPL5_9AGAR|nr:scamp-domain-containing protein [Cylindrobasidium torrendii FP15055 ss-10]